MLKAANGAFWACVLLLLPQPCEVGLAAESFELEFWNEKQKS
jgi:hypothetical protein